MKGCDAIKVHPEGVGTLGDEHTDPAEADDAEGLVVELDALPAPAVPVPGVEIAVGLRDVARLGEEQRDGELGVRQHVECGAFTTITTTGGGRHVDVVEADSAGTRLPARRPRPNTSAVGDLRGTADHEGGSPATASSSSAGVRSTWTSTSSPAARMASSPLAASVSVTRTRCNGARLTGEIYPEELGDALDALDDCIVAERERDAGVAGRAERLTGHDRDLRLVEQQLAQLERGRRRAARARARAPLRTTGSSRTRLAARGT